MHRPIIAVTMGDAAGIGPEIVVKALARPDVPAAVRALVIGDAGRLVKAAAIAGVSLNVQRVDGPASGVFADGTIDCVDLGLIPDDLPFGQLSAVAGDAAYRYIERAVALAMAGSVDAICTAPLNKEALRAGGHDFPGHTELLAHLTGTREVSMMLSAPGLRVIHCTTHLGLIDAIARIDPDLVARTIGRGHEALVRAGMRRRGSRSAASTRTPGSTGCSAAARKNPRSRQAWRARARPASTRRARCRLTRRSFERCEATSTSSSRCITIRATARSRCSASMRA